MPQTQILPVDPAHVDDQVLARAADLIRRGELVAFPTETVYGLGANAFDSGAVLKIFAAKGRPATDPLIVHISEQDQIGEVAASVPALARTLMARFWPGPLTLILPRAERIPLELCAGLPTVAVRMPAHPVALRLIQLSGVPIAAPSANRFSHTSPTTAQHVWDDLHNKIPLILDSGPTTVGVESTILDVSGAVPRILRPGGVSLDALREIVPDVEVITRLADPAVEAMPAPGMMLKHYSPRAEVRLIEGQPAEVRQALAAAAAEALARGHTVGLLVADEDCPALEQLDLPTIALGSLDDPATIARTLYAGLRTLDAQGVEIILARAFPPTGIGFAIRDRLLRAAEGRIIHV